MIKGLFSAALAASVLMLPAMRAQADVHALLGIAGGAIITCGITGACGNGNGGGNRTTASTRTCGPQCQGNVEAQRALDYFGYNPGGADGVWGQNSRRAASGFEAEMGFYPVDGQLNDMERGFLISSYQRAQSGYYGPHQQAYIQGGPRALLVSFNDERLGRFQAPGTTTVAAPTTTVVAPPSTTVVAPAPTTTVVNPAPSTTVVAPAPAEAPSFTGFTLASSMSAYCADAMQASPDVDVTLASAAMDQVMSQQFCLAMDATREDGAVLRASIEGMTPEQIVGQCQGLAGVLRATMDALGAQPREGAEVAARGALSGMPADQAINAGRICLSVGYEEDNADMALAAALTLSANGEPSYGELVGHHLREGFGVTANPAAAQTWLLSTVDAIEAGAAPAFLAAEASGRGAIIRAAYGSGGTVPGAVIDNAASGASLPTFTLSTD